MISSENLEFIRRRANYQCEYCTVSEVNYGGELTVDHFHPVSKGGNNELENLVYCCNKCNSYKHNYFPENEDDPRLWNPRIDNYNDHFITLENGVLHALTNQADFTIKLLRLNRKQLVSYRINAFKQSAQSKQLTQLQDLTKMLKEVNRQLISLNLEQQKLLQEQNTLLRTILNMQEGDPTKWSS